MKRIAQGVAVLLAIGVAAVQAQGQAPAAGALPTVDQVLEKCITALGGRTAIEKMTSRQTKGTIEIPDAGISGTIEIFEKAPDKSAAVVDLGVMQMREGFDGTVAWEDNPQVGMREKAGDELADARRSATFNPELKMKTLYPKMTVRGRETVGTRTAIVIDAMPAEGSPSAFFFDAENGLLIRNDTSRASPEGPVQIQAFLEDYRLVDGINMPHTVRQVTPQFTMIIRVLEVKHNVTLDDKMFKKPGL
jgi:hypothetical protein